jgi:hypothetical protein
VRGTHQGGLQLVESSEVGRVVARLKLQPSATVGGSSKGWLTRRLAKRCDTGCRTPTLDWSSSRSIARGATMKGANLGFASVLFEIPAQGPSIYRGFGLMISCACRIPSPSFPIRWGFGFHWYFSWRWQLPAWSVIWCGVGDDPAWAAPGPCVREARVGSARSGGECFGPWPYSRIKTFSIFQTIFQFANYFEFNSNLNFEWFQLTK